MAAKYSDNGWGRADADEWGVARPVKKTEGIKTPEFR
jgi:hypothetical protein